MCDRFPLEILMFKLQIKFPRATYHTIVPSTEELYCLIIHLAGVNNME